MRRLGRHAMNSASYWAYRDAGAYPDEYDPPEERERRTRCTCGAFLPSRPTCEGGPDVRQWPVTEWRRKEGHTGDEPEEFEEAITGFENVEVDWYEPSTDCRKCKRIWTETELWQD
jgi:hypothetical protein